LALGTETSDRCPLFNLGDFYMKKTLVALAALAATGASFAQATLYGVVDQGYYTETTSGITGISGTVTGMRSVLSGNRWGVDASEDLGGGLKAVAKMEYGAVVDNAATAGALDSVRNAYVGLNGGFGSFTMGRTYTLIHNVQGAFDPSGNATSAGWLGAASSRVRQSNAMTYSSPLMGGFGVDVQVGMGETAAPAAGGSSSTNDSTAFGVKFTTGALLLSLATETVKNAALTNNLGSSTAASQSILNTAVGSADADQQATSFGVSYDAGVAKLMAVRTTAKAGTANPAELTTNNFGVSVPFGALALNASVGNGAVSTGSNGTADLSAYQLGLNYSLSKRTTVYGLYGSTTAKTTGLTGLGATATADYKVNTTSIGLRHTF